VPVLFLSRCGVVYAFVTGNRRVRRVGHLHVRLWLGAFSGSAAGL
jgi:hypothetical protein